jgi:hypothetical protein
VSSASRVTSITASNVAEVHFASEEGAVMGSGKGQGIGLLGLYFANTNASGTVRLRLDPNIDFDWGVGEPIEGIGKDYFGVIWMGEVEAPSTGEFTFYLSADDGGRLQIGEKLFVGSEKKTNSSEMTASFHCERGQRYPLMVFYFDYLGPARARLAWAGPEVPRSVIPTDRLYPASYITEHQARITGTNGLLATYFTGNDLTGTSFTRMDPIIDGQGTLSSSSVRWTGRLQPHASEPTTFFAVSDGDVKVTLNGKVLLQRAAQRTLAESKATIPLSAGEFYDIEVEARYAPSAGVTRLLWSSPSQAKVVIPETCFRPYRASASVLSPTGPDLRLPAGIFFRNGSFVAGSIEKADRDYLQCSRLLAGNDISMRYVARIVCQPVPHAMSAKLQTERPGILLANGDFLEGELRSMESNGLELDSVLFGLRTFDTSRQVLAVVLHPFGAANGGYELHLKDRSIFSAERVAFEDGKLALTDSQFGRISLPEGDLVRLVRR